MSGLDAHPSFEYIDTGGSSNRGIWSQEMQAKGCIFKGQISFRQFLEVSQPELPCIVFGLW